ncbi:MAG TPA: deoxynucleoside kinase, partial [Archangium sp.]
MPRTPPRKRAPKAASVPATAQPLAVPEPALVSPAPALEAPTRNTVRRVRPPRAKRFLALAGN